MPIENLDDEPQLPLDLEAIRSEDHNQLAEYLTALVNELQQTKFYEIHQRINLLLEVAGAGVTLTLGTQQSDGTYPEGTWRLNAQSSEYFIIEIYAASTWNLVARLAASGGVWLVPEINVDTVTVNNTLTIASTLAVNGPLTLKTYRKTSTDSPYSVPTNALCLFVDTDGGAFTANLQSGVEGRKLRIVNCGSSGNDVTVNRAGSDTIRGGTSVTLADSEILDIVFNSTEGWW